MLSKTYHWMMKKAASDRAPMWLALMSFVESSVFPIPPDIMLIPMVLAQPQRWLRIAVLCTAASVAGGFLGYAIGALFMDSVGQWVLTHLGLMSKFEELRPWIDEYGVWVIIVKGATPIPYKLVTISAGAFHFDLAKFALASVIARGLRFFMVAALLWKFGTPIRAFIETRLTLVTTVSAVLLVGGFLLVKLL